MKFEIENISFIIQTLFNTTLYKPRKINFHLFTYCDREMMTGIIYHLGCFPETMELNGKS